MAKFKADINFKGIKEKKKFTKGEEFDMTVKRSEEVEKNIKRDYDIDKVMTRLDAPEEVDSDE